eukprot:TRINITY_DN11514_c0_g1_i1.p1 TRINITY_DN11514_c0_g1~~TRINITY_DN11514_c0_g1_i1.p1  ORF type:complete len:141 (-),score=38.46 TRINITY_DN11514_c0_g1_i1:18-440(-)
MKLIIFIIILISFIYAKDIKIRLNPNGKQEVVTINEGSSECVFTYNCLGGSSEEWDFSINSDGKQTMCSIGRRVSTMLFMDWKLQLNGISNPKNSRELSAFTENGKALLRDVDFTVEESDKEAFIKSKNRGALTNVVIVA